MVCPIEKKKRHPQSTRFNRFVGIDPGQSGGLAIVCVYPNMEVYPDMECAVPMPSTERDIWDWFNSLPPRTMALIELVHAMPGNGVSSMFKFGAGYGGLRMALIASGIPFEGVQPRAWQKELGIPPKKKTETKTQFKNKLKAKAQQLFPAEDVTLKTADALLIAEYCRRKHGEGL